MVLFCLRMIIGVTIVFRGIVATIVNMFLGIISMLVISNEKYYCTVGLL